MSVHAFDPIRPHFTLCDVKIPGSNVVVAASESRVLCDACRKILSKPPEPEPETTPFVLEYRLTKGQLEVIEWGMKNAHFRMPPKDPLDTPEKFMAYYLLREFTKAVEDMKKMRAETDVDAMFRKPRETPPPV